MSLKTANSITETADLFSASTVKNIVTLLKFVVIFKNTISVLFQNIIIMTAHSKAVSLFIIMLTAILNIQFNLSVQNLKKNN